MVEEVLFNCSRFMAEGSSRTPEEQCFCPVEQPGIGPERAAVAAAVKGFPDNWNWGHGWSGLRMELVS